MYTIQNRQKMLSVQLLNLHPNNKDLFIGVLNLTSDISLVLEDNAYSKKARIVMQSSYLFFLIVLNTCTSFNLK